MAVLAGCWHGRSPIPKQQSSNELRLGFGLAETGDPVAVLALAAFLEEFGAFKTLENVAFTAEGGGGAQAAML